MEGLRGIAGCQALDRRRLIAGTGGWAAALAWPTALRARCVPSLTEPALLPRTTGRVLHVVPNDPQLSLAATARAARGGDTILVAPGDYVGDVAVWQQSDLLIRGMGGRPRLIAGGRSAENKAIFVIKGDRVRLETLEFRGARVRDRNGAGIRQEGGPLSVHDCIFVDNENGILSGNIPTMELAVSNSTFLDNGNMAGSAHNLYVGRIARLEVEGCWFGRSRIGHLLKSRARLSNVRYNRLTGEDGTGSYELEFAEGGEAVVLGNLIQQGPTSENQAIVSYGAEGYRGMGNTLTLAFNTIVNDRTRGSTFVHVSKGAESATLAHNLFVGRGSLSIQMPFASIGNVEASRSEFANPDTFDFRLRANSALVGHAGFRGSGDRLFGIPVREYKHEASSCALEGLTSLTPLSPGAFQRLAR